MEFGSQHSSDSAREADVAKVRAAGVHAGRSGVQLRDYPEKRTKLRGSSDEGEGVVADLIKEMTVEMSLEERNPGTDSRSGGAFSMKGANEHRCGGGRALSISRKRGVCGCVSLTSAICGQ